MLLKSYIIVFYMILVDWLVRTHGLYFFFLYKSNKVVKILCNEISWKLGYIGVNVIIKVTK